MKNNGILNTLKDIVDRYRKSGRKGVTKGINNDYKVLLIEDSDTNYSKWILKNEKIEPSVINFEYEPLISIVVATTNIKQEFLQETLDSLLAQNYTNWELNSTNGDYFAFVESGDLLAPFALHEIVALLNKNRKIKLIYSDDDTIDEYGKRTMPNFKPDWNIDMFLSCNYISHLTVIKKETIEKTDYSKISYDSLENYNIFLQSIKYIDSSEIAHISKILYHTKRRDKIILKEKKELNALKNYFKSSKDIMVKNGIAPNTYKITYPIYNAPLVSIVIPTKDNYELLFTCIDSIVKRSTYVNYEIIIVDNQTTEQKALDYLEELACKKNIKVLKYNKQFNYAKINNYAVDYASGEFLAFLNNDIEVVTEGWIEEMLQHALREDIGIVGAKLHYPDMSIQHAGVVLGIGGIAGHAHKYFKEDSHGYFSRLKIIQNYSALTAACMVVKKSIFSDVNGFEEELEIAFNDIDLSLKVLIKGYRNLWTPYARLIHHESKSRGVEDTYEKKKRFQKEKDFMISKWEKELLSDKCYNKNLTLEDENFTLKL